jgi:hypothetical protein
MRLLDNIHKGESKTKEGLPRITSETMDQLNKEMQEYIKKGNSLPSKIEEFARELETENPLLLNFIYRVLDDRSNISLSSFVLMYQIMKTQAINNNISDLREIHKYFKQAEK